MIRYKPVVWGINYKTKRSFWDFGADPAFSYKPPKKQKLQRYAYLNMYSTFSKKKPKKPESTGSHGRRFSYSNSSIPAHLQQCVVKHRWGSVRGQHLAFLNSYLRQMKKKEVSDKPELFSEHGIIVDEEYLENYKKRATNKFYKFILSPERQDMDMTLFTQSFMERLEKVQGRKYDWIAAVHNDTGHVHSHILINGIDRAGIEVGKFTKKDCCFTARVTAREAATLILGPRTEKEINDEKERTFSARRFTQVDEDILKTMELQNALESRRFKTTNPRFTKRLDFLETIGLVSVVPENSTYVFENEWDVKLRNMGRYNAFSIARNNLKKHMPSDLKIYEGQEGEVEGTVTYVFRKSDNDELWTNAIVLENDNDAFYVPLYFEPSALINGKNIKLTSEKNSKGLLRPKIQIQKDR